MQQEFTRAEQGFVADGSVAMRFELSKPADVTIRIARHAAVGEGIETTDTSILPDPPMVRELHLGRLEAGKRQATWDGLDASARPVTERFAGFPPIQGQIADFQRFMRERTKDVGKANKPVTEDELVWSAPVDRFRISVLANGRVVATDFERIRGPVADFPTIQGMIFDGRQLPDGDFVVIDRQGWFGHRLGSDLKRIGRYPNVEAAWSANKPVEGDAIRVDRKGSVYIHNARGIYKYNADGSDGQWGADAPYINKLVLGVRLDGRLKEGEKKSYWTKGKEVKYDAAQAAELVKQPGFAYEWGPFDIGPDDCSYIVKGEPLPLAIEVFDPTGAYVRSITLPQKEFPNRGCLRSMRMDKDGKLWLNGNSTYRLDTQTGELEQTIRDGFDGFTFDSEGNVLGWRKGELARYTSYGKSLPFVGDSRYLIQEGARKGRLNFLRDVAIAREQDPTRGKLGVMSVLPGNSGDFYVLTWDTQNWVAFPRSPQPAVHLDRQGQVITRSLNVTWGQDRPGNVFVGDEPTRLHLYTTNLGAEAAPLEMKWTVTDFDGKQKDAHASFIAAPGTHQAMVLPLEMPEFGAYEVRGAVCSGDQVLMNLATRAARLRSRTLETSIDSPFAMVWGTNYYLSGISGVKKERVGAAGPPEFALGPDVLRPDLSEIISRRRGGLSGAIGDAKRWGVRIPILITYGEPWLSAHWMAPIYSYDTWLSKIVIPMVSKYSGPDLQHVQFWNEPNNFLYPPSDKKAREHYALLTKIIWNLCKACDKEGRSIPDADTSFEMMEKTLPEFSANEFTDAVCCHYPGASAVTWTTMNLPNAPEGKVSTIRQLLAIRDRYYPGKPLLNTEEGWWGHKDVKPVDAAAAVARVYIPEIAAGCDEIFWFAQSSVDNPTYMLGAGNTPWPSYCAYATMTRLLEGADYLGDVNLGVDGTFAYLFARGDEMVVPLWSVQGEPEVEIPIGAPQITVTDMMDRERVATAGPGGVQKLKLSLQTQYLSFPRNAWAQRIASAEVKRRLEALKLANAAAIPEAIEKAQATALNDNAAMSRLFYLVRAARQAALAGEAPALAGDAVDLARVSHQAILDREGPDGYLRRARVSYGWTERLSRLVLQQGSKLAPGLTWATKQAADATVALAKAERPVYPGVTVNAFVAPADEVAKIRATQPEFNKRQTAIDPQFSFQIEARRGETFDLELTVWNFYNHPIDASVEPRLPEGWNASRTQSPRAIEPGCFAREMLSVTVPPESKPGLYQVGGKVRYQGQDVSEVHVQRVKVQ